MNKILARADKFHKTTVGYALFWIIELIIAYIFASLAINDGSLWFYLLTLIFLVGFLRDFFKFVDSLFHVKVKK